MGVPLRRNLPDTKNYSPEVGPDCSKRHTGLWSLTPTLLRFGEDGLSIAGRISVGDEEHKRHDWMAL